ncbi:PAS domain-containing protein [Frigidibacter albus]|uniref:PAS domain-containing protein n=1 Tax=Frigidibacter albus TaxID=1465486 RepID=A0A6L8VCU4_9RHOB|nr:PAS domain-containing protein [Frigidibacter albus]MZQ88073.1 PAS domain-containing protein [Frigidibacter albus]NBE30253.1 PAS domain-containing protein [Frigidibacter albus]GGH47640.1 PAS domain-containing protein [Frigidibacter albus]
MDKRFQVTAEMRGYWEGLRGGRGVPLRSAVDPRGIERALEHAFILERIAPSIARFRLAGMHLSDLMGMEVRGMPLTSFFTPKARPLVAAVLEAVFQGPEIAELTLAGEGGFGKPALQAKLLILPLKSDLGDVTRALGCLVADGQIGRAPRRFDVIADSRTKVATGSVAAPEPALGSGFSEAARAFQPAPAPIGAPSEARRETATPEERRAMMRLVRSD